MLKDYEKQVLEILTRHALPPSVLSLALQPGVTVCSEHTGGGYYLTVRHPALPKERIVCDQPLVSGASEGIDCGFIVFLEDHELTLECHAWGLEPIPQDYRDQTVQITTTYATDSDNE